MTLKNPFTKKWSLILLFFLLCLVGIQFIRPGLDSQAVTADLAAPPAVKQIIERACYDCHSNKTNLAWFDQLAPAYWLVRTHILDGRRVLNFSYWGDLSKGQQKAILFESLNQIAFKEMPLPQYRALHPGSKVTDQEMRLLRNYLDTLAPEKTSDPKRNTAGNDQYSKWIEGSTSNAVTSVSGVPAAGSAASVNGVPAAAAPVKPAPNGIAYIQEYKDWEAISSTERFDNGTLRVILGNETAIRAIKEHHISPCPDGTQFAKVAWDAVKDSTGMVHTGEFKQVEFMIKDSHKYADTEGWGWGRWKGIQLQPYGKTALFTTECTNCHRPLQASDFVFTLPLDLSTKK